MFMSRGEFPLQVVLSARSVGWRSDEIDQWIASRPRRSAGRSGQVQRAP
jgi:predicted DNA-binding transcriptional regulator AlpA